jgi:hypothetical protein
VGRKKGINSVGGGFGIGAYKKEVITDCKPYTYGFIRLKAIYYPWLA